MTHTKSLKVFYHTIYTLRLEFPFLSLFVRPNLHRHTHVRIIRGNSCARETHCSTLYIVCKTDSALSQIWKIASRETHAPTILAFISICWFSARRARERAAIFLVPFSSLGARWFVFFILASPDAQRVKLMNAAFIIFQTQTLCAHSLFHGGARVGSNYWPVHLSRRRTTLTTFSLVHSLETFQIRCTAASK
jgi:hypothetical protein